MQGRRMPRSAKARPRTRRGRRATDTVPCRWRSVRPRKHRCHGRISGELSFEPMMLQAWQRHPLSVQAGILPWPATHAGFIPGGASPRGDGKRRKQAIPRPVGRTLHRGGRAVELQSRPVQRQSPNPGRISRRAAPIKRSIRTRSGATGGPGCVTPALHLPPAPPPAAAGIGEESPRGRSASCDAGAATAPARWRLPRPRRSAGGKPSRSPRRVPTFAACASSRSTEAPASTDNAVRRRRRLRRGPPSRGRRRRGCRRAAAS